MKGDIRSMDKARFAFRNSSTVCQTIDGKFHASIGVVVCYATGKKFIESGELKYVGPVKDVLGDRISDCYVYSSLEVR